MNFIKHFLAWMDKLANDDRLTPHHVSLYITLFQFWNLNHFRNPGSISRHEVMLISKVGSVNTYGKCLKELHEWGYIRYEPSFNPQRGSKVHLFRFDKGSDNATDKADDTATDKGREKVVIPSKNILNNPNNVNKENAYEPTNENSDSDNRWQSTQPEEAGIHPGDKRGGAAVPPQMHEVQLFFTQQKSSVLEAEKFFNYFQSNGWKVGGRAPMQDWKAAARNWILNTKKFNNEKPGHTKLDTSPDKNFAEPL